MDRQPNGSPGELAAAQELGAALYQARQVCGLSLRAWARALNLSGHSGLVDYERGRRIPPADIVAASERIFGVSPGGLAELRDRALAERAGERARQHRDRLGQAIPAAEPDVVTHGILTGPVATVEAGPDQRGAGTRQGRSREAHTLYRPPLPIRQLPREVGDFTGREAKLAQAQRAALAGPSAPQILVVTGIPGVGKTTFILRLANLMAPLYPDGQFYLPLRTTSRRHGATEALKELLQSLGLPDSRLPSDTDAQARLYRSLLAGGQYLVVLDDPHDEKQLRPLLPPAGCLTLVASRRRLSAVEGAWHTSLDVLSTDEATRLLGAIAGQARVAAEPKAAAAAVRLCGRLPLAIRIAGSRLAARPNWSICELASRLDRQRRRLRELSTGDIAVRASLELSYVDLAPAAARLFRRLGELPGPVFHVGAASAVSDRQAGSVRAALEHLADVGLLTHGSEPARFEIHELIRLYALERARSDPPEPRAAARRRLVEWYVGTAAEAGRLVSPLQRLLPEDLLDIDQPPAKFASPSEAAAWLVGERLNLVAVAVRAATEGPCAGTWLIADSLRGFLFHHRYVDDWLAITSAGSRAALREQHLPARSAMAMGQGQALSAQGNWVAAIRALRRALRLARAAGLPCSESVVLSVLGGTHFQAGQLSAALTCHAQALAVNRNMANQRGMGIALANLASIHRELGDPAAALRYQAEALELHRKVGNQHSIALTYCNRANAFLQLGDYDSAQRDCEQAIATWSTLGSRLGLAIATCTSAAVQLHVGNYDLAERYARKAADAARELGDPWVEVDASNTLAGAMLRQGRVGEAAEVHAGVVVRSRELGSVTGEVAALIGQAECEMRAGHAQAGLEAAKGAVERAHATSYRAMEGMALTVLAEACSLGGNHPAGARYADEALAMLGQANYPSYQIRALLVRRSAAC